MFNDVKLISIDLGNTLVFINYKVVNKVCNKFGIKFSRYEFRLCESLSRITMNKYIRNLDSGQKLEGRTLFRKYISSILIEKKGVCTTNFFNEIADLLYDNYSTSELWSDLLYDVESSLSKLKGAGVDLVISSNSDGSVTQSLKKIGIDKYITKVYDSELMGVEKPSKEFFLRICSDFCLPPEKIVHIGDSYVTDIEGCINIGMKAVYIEPLDKEDIDNVLVVSDFNEFVSIFLS
jgi:FMN phosphatase YigB (HAD superfamily)